METKKTLGYAYLITAVALVAAVIFSYLAIIPAYNDYKEAKSQLKDTEIRLAKLQEIQSKLQTLKRDFANKQKEVKEMKVAIPTEEDLENILVSLQNQAGTLGVEFIALEKEKTARAVTSSEQAQQTAKEAQAAAVSEIQLTLTLQGNYEKLREFILALEKNLRISDATNMKLEIASTATPDIVKAIINFKTYVQK